MNRGRINEMVLERTGGNVQAGPFRGMKVTAQSCWGDGDLTPKLLGVYEEELHDILLDAIQKNYEAIVNIGSAEGFYAVGLALRCQSATVYAYDSNAASAAILRGNAELNEVAANRIRLEGACTAEHLIALAREYDRLFVLCDCEGFETTLFSNSDLTHALRNSDVLVECHDFVDSRCTPTVFGAFWNTHLIDVIYTGSRNPSKFAILSGLSDIERWTAVCENRPRLMNWLFCRAR
jgi:hypothetical protein